MQRTMIVGAALLLGLGLILLGPSASADRERPGPRQPTSSSESDPAGPDGGDRLRQVNNHHDALRTGLPAPRGVRGTRKVIVLRTKWRGATATVPSAKKLRKQVGRSSDSLALLSNGRMRLSRAVVSPVLKIAPPRAGACMAQYRRLQKLAFGAAKEENPDLRRFDHVLIYLPCADGFAAGLGDMPGDTVWLFASIDPGVITHEIGHNLGLGHANRQHCRRAGTPTSTRGKCVDEEYGDPYDVMGVLGSSLSSANLDRLGWLGGKTVVKNAGSYSLHTLSRPGGSTRALRIRSARNTYWVDYRTGEGADSNKYLSPGQVTGVQVRQSLPDSTRLIDAAPGRWEKIDPYGAGYNAIPPGSSLTLPGDVRLTVTSADGDQATVKVQRNKRAGRPDRPRNVSATPGPRSATVTWERPDDNGATIGRYRVTALRGAEVVKTTRIVTTGGRITSVKMGGLDAGQGYTFTVRALNEYGASPASAPSAPISPTRRGLAISLSEPSDGQTVHATAQVSFNVNRDRSDQSPMVSAELLVDGTSVGPLDIFPDDDYGSGQWTSTDTSTTDHTLQIRATDAAGTTTLSKIITVTVVPLDYTVGLGPAAEGYATLTWSGADAAALQWLDLEIEEDGTWVWYGSPDPSSGSESIDLPSTPGTYRVRVTSYFSWDDGGYYEDTRDVDVTLQ